ncbi:MAG TPA: hypothetical protein VFG20_09430 [Planctomycetaceae bacterium]|nr:hypothetical protein [Planctomycetaceae bacterium]
MSAINTSTSFGNSALHALQQLSARTNQLVDRVTSPGASGDLSDFAQAVVEMNELKLQTRAAVSVMYTTHTLAQEMLSLPRR